MNQTAPARDYFRDLLRNRALLFSAIFVTVLCYGFAITHFSIGIDDVARNYYFYGQESWNMIQQGRLLHLLLNGLTHAIDWIPFFTEFVGAALYCLSALLFCGLFQTVCEGKLSAISLIAFTVVYLSSSINVEKFLYHLDVIATMTSYCACALGLLYAYRAVALGERRAAIPAVPLVMCAIASYESFLFLYICGVFAILMLEILKNPKQCTFSALLRSGLHYALILIVAVLAYYGLVAAVQLLSGQPRSASPYTVWQDTESGFFPTFCSILSNILSYFHTSLSANYVPVRIFTAVSCAGGVLTLLLSLRRKNVWLIPCFAALFLSNFCIHIILGGFHPRIAQTFCFYVGFLVLLGTAWCERKKAARTVAVVCVSLLVFVQSADMNRWFYNDYVRYQKEAFVVNTIATKLAGSYDLSKPVVFTNCPSHWKDDSGYLMTRLYEGGDVNGNSVIYWCGNTVTDYCPTFASDLFRLHGYDFLVSPTREQARRAQKLAEGMPVWPQEGCIREFEDLIAVNFG
ncbi:MAG: glucosyltransferase domain-containing protein [Candidatus Faecousia sp.]|nr:glucosyltransferase domain-containing protein [Candidatus Faecousia sp.]